MRGLMFELLVAFLATRIFGGKTDLRVLHTHRRSGKKVEIDVFCAGISSAVYTIECKGKILGGTVSLREVEEWLGKLPIIGDYVASRPSLRECGQTHAFWTTGSFEPDALEKLKYEQQRRTKRPIEWKDGKAVRAIASRLKLKSMSNALRVHF